MFAFPCWLPSRLCLAVSNAQELRNRRQASEDFPHAIFLQRGHALGAGLGSNLIRGLFLEGHIPQVGRHFHELVHVVQWEHLGPEKFLLAYGAGLVRFGYERSPLEQMAYVFQANFERGFSLPHLSSEIRFRTATAWSEVASLFGA